MKKSVSLRIAAGVLSVFALSSCVFDGRSDCYLSVGFSYTCNVKEADAFPSEVRDVELFVFDSGGAFIESFRGSAEGGFPAGYRMRLPSLGAGSYTFVAIGRNRIPESPAGEFAVAALEAGKSNLADLTLLLDAEEGVSRTDFASIYDGVLTAELRDGAQRIDIPLMKLTNRLRLLLMPYEGTEPLNPDDYSIFVESAATWLDFQGDMYSPRPVTFLPFAQESYSRAEPSPGEIGGVAVADFQLSRLLCADAPALVIASRSGGNEIARVNLAWLLSLQGVAEHRREWSDQEYLDRQDAYSITFFLDGGVFVRSRIIINGWVLSLSDVPLG